LESLTTLPKNTKFENKGDVNLESLTTLPENTKFENKGYVDLRSLTTLPENTKFGNQGDVYLESLTTLPKNTKFENKGDVYLESLTTLPENTKFENKGYVYLESLNNKEAMYQGKKIKIKHIDWHTMIISSSKKVDSFIIHKARYFNGGEFKAMHECFIAERGNYYAHGETISEAISDVNFKYLRETSDIQEIISGIKRKKTVTVEEYRLITGACAMGIKMFMQEKNITDKELPLEQVLKITKCRYGWDRMSEIFGGTHD